MREQTRAGKATFDGTRRSRRLHDPVAAIAAQLRPHMADDLEAGPDAFQHLGHILTELAQLAAAVGAAVVIGHMGMDSARKMLREWAAERLRGCGTLCLGSVPDLFDGTSRLQRFQLQLQLLDLAQHLLALGSEKHPLQLLDQHHQALDLGCARAQLLMLDPRMSVQVQDHRLQCSRIESIQIGQAECLGHVRSMSQN